MGLGLRKHDLKRPGDRFITRIDRRIASNFDWILLGMILLLIAIGLTNLYSATRVPGKEGYFATQLRWSFIGMVFLATAFVINYRHFEGLSYWVYGSLCFFLLLVLLIGPEINGVQRWLKFGKISFQPSEVAKIGLVMALAKYLANNRVPSGYNFRELIIPGAIILLPTFLIYREPDLGTALLFVLIGGSMLLYSGIRKTTLLGMLIFLSGFIPVVWKFLLKEYQRNRIRTLLGITEDPLNTGYHIDQSLAAIGSGKIFGKGFLQGTQNKLGFLPEHHTDFVFPVFAEEWGFVGCFVLLALYFGIIVWSMSIALYTKDRYASFMAIGLAAIIFWHAFINIGMVIGIAPVVGMPLPFLSYGRSALLTMMVVVGMLLNISSRRYVF